MCSKYIFFFFFFAKILTKFLCPVIHVKSSTAHTNILAHNIPKRETKETNTPKQVQTVHCTAAALNDQMALKDVKRISSKKKKKEYYDSNSSNTPTLLAL